MSEVLEWTHDIREFKKDALPGEWDNEPDKIQWVDESTGLDCLMVRQQRSGHWCGYVGVTEGHPFFEVGYNKCLHDHCDGTYCEHSIESTVSVHGGVTFTSLCHESEEGPGFGVCHTPFPGRPDKVWWIGFDCAHAGDLCPTYSARWLSMGLHDLHEVYRNVEYVKEQCGYLAAQLYALR